MEMDEEEDQEDRQEDEDAAIVVCGELTDTHCHLPYAEGDVADDCQPPPDSPVVTTVYLMGTTRADWPQVAAAVPRLPLVAAALPKAATVAGRESDSQLQLQLQHTDTRHVDVVPFFGVHPWFAHDQPVGWLAVLEELLVANPHAGVGEIGLDYKATIPGTGGTIDKEAQMSTFTACMDLAARHSRPASVHCVKAFQPILEFLQSRQPAPAQRRPARQKASGSQKPGELQAKHVKEVDSRARTAAPLLPPAFCMHSYGGSPEFADLLLRTARRCSVDLFFGVSGVINLRSEKRCRRLLEQLPISCILLESDNTHHSVAFPSLIAMATFIAEVKQLDVAEALTELQQNAARFISSLG